MSTVQAVSTVMTTHSITNADICLIKRTGLSGRDIACVLGGGVYMCVYVREHVLPPVKLTCHHTIVAGPELVEKGVPIMVITPHPCLYYMPCGFHIGHNNK